MKPSVVGILVAAALLVSPLFLGAATAADVNESLIASGFVFHFGTTSGTNEFTINAGDTLHLTITNPTDNTPHTFTLPHFGIDRNIPANATVLVNITTTTSDAGRWQFHCTPHSTGSGENWAGMVGYLTVQGPTPPKTPGFEAVAAIGALLAAFVVVAVWRRKD